MQEQKNEEKNNDTTKNVKGVLSQLEASLEEYMVKKAPFTIPKGGKEFIVSVAPYLVIIGAIFAVLAILGGLGLAAMVAPLALLGAHFGMAVLISVIFTAISLVLEVMAVPGLFARTRKGWRLVFYASVVSLIGNILVFNIVGGIIGALIGWYILFQVRELYK